MEKQTVVSEKIILMTNKNTAKEEKADGAKKLSFDDYECCLRYLSSKHVNIKRIGSYHH